MAVQSMVSVLLVAVRAATEVGSLVVAVSKFAMASTVFFGRRGWPTDRRD